MVNIFDNLNPILKQIIFSLSITLAIALLGSLFLLNFGFNFFISFFFLIILQFVGFYFYGDYVKRKNAVIQAKLELMAASELKKITVDVVCPCDKKVETTIPIEMNSENVYTCGQCNKKIKIILDAKTALKTDPLLEDPLKNPDLIEKFEEVLKDPSHNDRL